jgi:hypothetical protein
MENAQENVQPAEQSKLIAKLMQMGVDTMNNELDVEGILRKEAEGEDRTVKFLIFADNERFIDSGRLLFSQGYHVVAGKITPVNLAGYTVTYKLNESTWISLITQRRSFRQLYWYGEMEAEGDYVLRDFMIWSRFFEQYGEKIKVPFAARAFLRPAKGAV